MARAQVLVQEQAPEESQDWEPGRVSVQAQVPEQVRALVPEQVRALVVASAVAEAPVVRLVLARA